MTLILADRVDVVHGRINDLKHGVIPSPWIERGWRAKWKHNPAGLVRWLATTAVVITAGLMLLSRKRKKGCYKS